MPEQQCPKCRKPIVLSDRKRHDRFLCPYCGDAIRFEGGALHSLVHREPQFGSAVGEVVGDDGNSLPPQDTATTNAGGASRFLGSPKRKKIQKGFFRSSLDVASPSSAAVGGGQKTAKHSAQLPSEMASARLQELPGSVLLSWPVLAIGLFAVCVSIFTAVWLAQFLETKAETSVSERQGGEGISLGGVREGGSRIVEGAVSPTVDPALADIQLARAVLPSASSPEILAQVQRVVPSVVTIVAVGSEEKALGTGFVAGRRDWLVTSLRVVAGIQRCMAVARSATGDVIDSRKIVGFVGCDPAADLVVLKLDDRWLTEPLAVELGGATALLGNQVFGVAAVDRVTNYVVRGCVLVDGSARELQLRELGDGIRVIQTDLPFVPGLRGGPLLAEGGGVVGLMSLGFATTETGGAKSPYQWVHAIAAGELLRILRGCFERPLPLAQLPRYR